MADTITVKIAPLPRGTYSSSATYAKLDVVSYNGSSYMAIKAVPTGTVPTNTTYWQLLAEKPTISTGSITTAMLADGSVTSAKLGSNAVTSAKIASNAVTSAKIADGNITTAKLADESVTLEKLSDEVEEQIYNGYPTDIAKGTIASFPDGADNVPFKSHEVSISPIQDLNGYDSPWVGGAGKNLLPETAVELGAYGTTGSKSENGNAVYRRFAVTLKAGTYTFSTSLSNAYILRMYANGTNTAISSARSSYTFTLSADSEVKFCFRNSSSTEITESFTCQIESGSTVTAFVPYSNICPITGWTGANVVRTGKNFLNTENISNGSSGGVSVVRNADGSLTLNGTTTNAIILTGNIFTGYYGSGTAQNDGKRHIPVGRYWLSTGHTTAQGVAIQIYGTNNLSGTSNLVQIGAWGTSGYINVPDNLRYNFARLYISANTTLNNVVVNPMLYYAPTNISDMEYEQGTEQRASISFSSAGTVYGGTLDVKSGVLTVTHVLANVSDRSNWTKLSSQDHTFYSTFTGKAYGRDNVISDSYKQPPSTSGYVDGQINGSPSNTAIYITDYRYSTASDFMANCGDVQFVYPLATPLTYQLTPTQINSLLGENNVWSDTGETEVIYRADTSLYIQKLTGSTEDDMVANQNIAIHKYFMVGNQLYYSTSAITTGQKIVVGTNCTLTNLADALNALNA